MCVEDVPKPTTLWVASGLRFMHARQATTNSLVVLVGRTRQPRTMCFRERLFGLVMDMVSLPVVGCCWWNAPSEPTHCRDYGLLQRGCTNVDFGGPSKNPNPNPFTEPVETGDARRWIHLWFAVVTTFPEGWGEPHIGYSDGSVPGTRDQCRIR